jgi:hypothetical protein
MLHAAQPKAVERSRLPALKNEPTHVAHYWQKLLLQPLLSTDSLMPAIPNQTGFPQKGGAANDVQKLLTEPEYSDKAQRIYHGMP